MNLKPIRNLDVSDVALDYWKGIKLVKLNNDEMDSALHIHRMKLGYNINKPMGAKEHIFWRNATILRNRAEQATDFRDALTYVYEFDRPYFLEKWWSYLSQRQKKHWLYFTWIRNDSTLIQGFNWWIRKFRSAGYITNCEVYVNKPITLYRGCLRGIESGLSWTDDIQIARRYARQYADVYEAYIFKTTVKKNNVLAVLHVDGEDVFTGERFSNLEYIVDSKELKIEAFEKIAFK